VEAQPLFVEFCGRRKRKRKKRGKVTSSIQHIQNGLHLGVLEYAGQIDTGLTALRRALHILVDFLDSSL
jgi:hypothetical protein